jgi:hypothetical protein
MLDLLLKVIKGGQKKKHVEEHRVRRREVLAKLSGELTKLEEVITEKNAHQKAREFYTIVRGAFKESLSLNYEATCQEVQEEINKRKHYSEDLREETNDFLSDVALMEYGYPQLNEILEEKRHEQEQKLRKYIHDLEDEGDHMKQDTKRKIATIVSENIPHTDKELLVKTIARFRSLLHRIL